MPSDHWWTLSYTLSRCCSNTKHKRYERGVGRYRAPVTVFQVRMASSSGFGGSSPESQDNPTTPGTFYLIKTIRSFHSPKRTTVWTGNPFSATSKSFISTVPMESVQRGRMMIYCARHDAMLLNYSYLCLPVSITFFEIFASPTFAHPIPPSQKNPTPS